MLESVSDKNERGDERVCDKKWKFEIEYSSTIPLLNTNILSLYIYVEWERKKERVDRHRENDKWENVNW